MFSHYDHQTLPYAPRPPAAPMERDQWKLDAELAPNCPRCDSFNTKFCYYNNYSLTQPRYFCKGCRRYWTKGGSLRNVPIGDGCRRKTRRGKSVSAGTGRSSSGSNFGTSLRPDLVLDEMVGNMSTDSPTIDLAVLYANFMNQRPIGEALDQMAPVQLQGQEACCSMEESMLSTEDQVLIEGIVFGMDGCGNLQEEQTVMGDHHVSLPSCSLVDLSTWEDQPRFQEFDPLPEQYYYNMLHDQEFAIGDWCTLDPSGLSLI